MGTSDILYICHSDRYHFEQIVRERTPTLCGWGAPPAVITTMAAWERCTLSFCHHNHGEMPFHCAVSCVHQAVSSPSTSCFTTTFIYVLMDFLSFLLEQSAVFSNSLGQKLLSRCCSEIRLLQPLYINKHAHDSDNPTTLDPYSVRNQFWLGAMHKTGWQQVVRVENYAIFVLPPHQRDARLGLLIDYKKAFTVKTHSHSLYLVYQVHLDFLWIPHRPLPYLLWLPFPRLLLQSTENMDIDIRK